MTKDHNPRRSDSEWTELIAECRRSGLSDDCWCKNNGIPISTFYNAVIRISNGTDPQLLSHVLHLMGDIQ